MSKELLLFIRTGKEKLIEEMKEKYIEHDVYEYYTISNNFIMRHFNIVKVPTVIVLENGVEIKRV